MLKDILAGLNPQQAMQQQAMQQMPMQAQQMPMMQQPMQLDPYGQQMGGVKAALMGRMFNGF